MANETLLFDTMLKHQVKLERFKLWMIETFHAELNQLRPIIRAELIPYDLDTLTLGRFKQLRDRVVRAVSKHGEKIKARLIELLVRFIGVEYETNIRIWDEVSRLLAEDDDEAGGVILSYLPTGDAWVGQIDADPIPALGETWRAIVDAFFNAVLSRVYTQLTTSYLTKVKTKDAIEAVVGGAATNYKTGSLPIILRQATSMLDTIIQSIGTRTQSAVQRATRLPWADPPPNAAEGQGADPTPPPGSGSGQNPGNRTAPVGSRCYIWISVLDGRTTIYCRNQNGRIYVYGFGPLPPAHPHCRSTIMPFVVGQTSRRVAANEIDVSRPLSLDDYSDAA